MHISCSRTVCSCRLHGELAANVVRDSASAVQKEMLEAYALIESLGRGVVYYGSARLKSTSAHWDRARALGRDVAKLLGCTTWSGGGPGMMEAATLGEAPQCLPPDAPSMGEQALLASEEVPLPSHQLLLSKRTIPEV